VYRAVRAVEDAWASSLAAPDERVVQHEVREVGGDRLLDTARALGADTAGGVADPLLRQAVHDLRGGSLSILVATAGLLRLGDAGPTLLATCVALARDHARIMRNAVPDLDPAGRAADEAERPVPAGDFLRPWAGATVQVGHRPVVVAVDCRFEGAVAGRNLEAAALDRVLYNLFHNAARFAADGRVALTAFTPSEGLVRWVVSNAVGEDQRGWLEGAAGTDLGRLFAGGLTRGGQGVGLSACAGYVAGCFGLPSGADAVARGYAGARLLGDRFHAWFHWPAYRPEPGPG
jgi:hypothetical protein